MPVKRERDTAIRAVARFAAIAAKQRRGKTAPVQKQNCLLAFLQTISNCLRQFFRQNSGFLFPPSFLAQIVDAHARYLFLVDALRESDELILANSSVVITLERRCGAAQNHDALLDLRPHDRDVAGELSQRCYWQISARHSHAARGPKTN